MGAEREMTMSLFNRKPKHVSPDEQEKPNERLIEASIRGDTKTVKALLANGANVHARDDWALCLAGFYGHAETVRVLAKHIFTPDSWRGKTREEIEAKARDFYQKIEAFGATPERLREAATVLADAAIDCWHQVRPAPPKFQISPLPAQP